MSVEEEQESFEASNASSQRASPHNAARREEALQDARNVFVGQRAANVLVHVMIGGSALFPNLLSRKSHSERTYEKKKKTIKKNENCIVQ